MHIQIYGIGFAPIRDPVDLDGDGSARGEVSGDCLGPVGRAIEDDANTDRRASTGDLQRAETCRDASLLVCCGDEYRPFGGGVFHRGAA